MKIRIDIEGQAVTSTLVDSETSKDFVSLLPLTLTLKDYAATEKISDLSEATFHQGRAWRCQAFCGRRRLLRPLGKPRHIP